MHRIVYMLLPFDVLVLGAVLLDVRQVHGRDDRAAADALMFLLILITDALVTVIAVSRKPPSKRYALTAVSLAVPQFALAVYLLVSDIVNWGIESGVALLIPVAWAVWAMFIIAKNVRAARGLLDGVPSIGGS